MKTPSQIFIVMAEREKSAINAHTEKTSFSANERKYTQIKTIISL